MFEIIKCYMRLRRMDKLNRGFIKVGKVLENDEMIKTAEEVLRLSTIVKKKIWFNRKLAKNYNLQFERQGFK